MDLLGGDDSDSEVKWKINERYASDYPKWRQKEFIRKLTDKTVGHGVDGSSSSSEDDEDAKDLPHLEKGFFAAMSYLKRKDPQKYNDNAEFFPKLSTSTEDNNKDKKEKKDKPFVFRDYERQIMLERGGKFVDDEDEKKIRSPSPTYVDEQKALKESFKNVLQNSDSDDDNENIGSLLRKKKKTAAEIKKEDDDYKEWLKGRKNELKDKNIETELKDLHDFWNDPNLNVDDAYLKDYILNKRFLEDEDVDFQPEHNEIVHDYCELDTDGKFVEEMEKFERKYNFRFEEPDPEYIKRYPRFVESSLRQKDDKRKRTREEVRARKEAEKLAKREEIKQLKSLKKKEILEKIKKIKEITGNDDVDFDDEDFEEDFNPEKYDKKMNELFNDEYYGVEESKKPECPELEEELEIENWDNWNGKETETEQLNGFNGEESWTAPACEDPNFIMDCDYDPKAELQEEMKRISKNQRKVRKKSKFAEAISRKKPVFNPNDETFEEYFDEYYQLDCEDIINDLPCRFKYRKTTPNDYGLTTDEILRADVKELNEWCSLKKVVKYKPSHVENNEVLQYKWKGRNEALKRKILPSLYRSDPTDNGNENTTEVSRKHEEKVFKSQELGPKRKLVACSNSGTAEKIGNNKKKNNQVIEATEKDERVKSPKTKKPKLQSTFSSELNSIPREKNDRGSTNVSFTTKRLKKKKLHKKYFDKSVKPDIPVSDERLKAYGINPKKFQNKLKYGNKQNPWVIS